MITALFTGFRLKFKIKYTEIVSHDKLQSSLKSISSRFNSNAVKLPASQSSKNSTMLTFLQQKHDKGRHIACCEAWRVPRSKVTVGQLVHLKNLLKAHKNSLANFHFELGGSNSNNFSHGSECSLVPLFFCFNSVQSILTTIQQFYMQTESASQVIKWFQIFLSYF